MRLTEEEYREETDLTTSEVKLQLDEHGVIFQYEFFDAVGHEAPFTGEELLNWLGY